MSRIRAALLLLLALAAPAGAQRIRVEDIPTRPGQSVRTLSVQPAERILGTVILMPGGHGNLGLTPSGSFSWGENNQLVRARLMFARAGMLAVVADIAPDLKLGTGVVGGYRFGQAHAQDIGALVRHFRQFGAPVYLVGTSRAAVSVANAAARLTGPARPDALVITSGMVVDVGQDQPSVQRSVQGLDRITQPVLLVAHVADGCRLTPPGALAQVRAMLPNAARVDTRTLSGGRGGQGDPCEANGPHGFLGLDQQVVDLVVGWLGGLPRS